jgi:hypothetical protein
MPGWLVELTVGQRKFTGSVAFLALAVVLLGIEHWASGGKNVRYQAARTPRLFRSTIPIVPGIYVLGGLSPSAAYVIETSEGLILVCAVERC